jgi:hypothetical protein
MFGNFRSSVSDPTASRGKSGRARPAGRLTTNVVPSATPLTLVSARNNCRWSRGHFTLQLGQIAAAIEAESAMSRMAAEAMTCHRFRDSRSSAARFVSNLTSAKGRTVRATIGCESHGRWLGVVYVPFSGRSVSTNGQTAETIKFAEEECEPHFRELEPTPRVAASNRGPAVRRVTRRLAVAGTAVRSCPPDQRIPRRKGCRFRPVHRPRAVKTRRRCPCRARFRR